MNNEDGWPRVHYAISSGQSVVGTALHVHLGRELNENDQRAISRAMHDLEQDLLAESTRLHPDEGYIGLESLIERGAYIDMPRDSGGEPQTPKSDEGTHRRAAAPAPRTAVAPLSSSRSEARERPALSVPPATPAPAKQEDSMPTPMTEKTEKLREGLVAELKSPRGSSRRRRGRCG
jgi:hypothetical protein